MRRAHAAAIVAIAVSLAGCGAGHDQPAGRIRGNRLTLYVSVPLHGLSAASGGAIVNGARMALDGIGGRIGRYGVVLKPLDDSNPAKGGWDPGATSNNAKLVAADASAIGYIGDQDSGASAVSIPVLNRAGIPQISPTSTAVGLTSAAPGAAPGEPDKYYPAGVRTFARVAASDASQAAAQVRLQRSAGCRRTYVLDDAEVDGEDLATSFDLAARAAGPDVVATQEYDVRATDYRPLATSIAATGARCVLIAAVADSNAVALTNQLAAALPGVQIFGGAALAEMPYASGLSPTTSVMITSPALGAGAYPAAGRAWTETYTRRYGVLEPDAILGYEATRLMLSAIASATDHGRRLAERSQVVKAIFSRRPHRSVLGTYTIAADGDASSRAIGVWDAADGKLTFWKALEG